MKRSYKSIFVISILLCAHSWTIANGAQNKGVVCPNLKKEDITDIKKVFDAKKFNQYIPEVNKIMSFLSEFPKNERLEKEIKEKRKAIQDLQTKYISSKQKNCDSLEHYVENAFTISDTLNKINKDIEEDIKYLHNYYYLKEKYKMKIDKAKKIIDYYKNMGEADGGQSVKKRAEIKVKKALERIGFRQFTENNVFKDIIGKIEEEEKKIRNIANNTSQGNKTELLQKAKEKQEEKEGQMENLRKMWKSSFSGNANEDIDTGISKGKLKQRVIDEMKKLPITNNRNYSIPDFFQEIDSEEDKKILEKIEKEDERNQREEQNLQDEIDEKKSLLEQLGSGVSWLAGIVGAGVSLLAGKVIPEDMKEAAEAAGKGIQTLYHGAKSFVNTSQAILKWPVKAALYSMTFPWQMMKGAYNAVVFLNHLKNRLFQKGISYISHVEKMQKELEKKKLEAQKYYDDLTNNIKSLIKLEEQFKLLEDKHKNIKEQEKEKDERYEEQIKKEQQESQKKYQVFLNQKIQEQDSGSKLPSVTLDNRKYKILAFIPLDDNLKIDDVSRVSKAQPKAVSNPQKYNDELNKKNICDYELYKAEETFPAWKIALQPEELKKDAALEGEKKIK